MEVIDDHHALFLVAIQSDRQAIAPGTLELEFQDLGYYAEDTEAPRFVPVLSGTWNLSWALTTVEEGRNLDLTEHRLGGNDLSFDRLNLTPLSLSVSGSYGTGPVEELPWNFTYPPITLHFQDGSQQSLNSDPSSATTYLTGGASTAQTTTSGSMSSLRRFWTPPKSPPCRLATRPSPYHNRTSNTTTGKAPSASVGLHRGSLPVPRHNLPHLVEVSNVIPDIQVPGTGCPGGCTSSRGCRPGCPRPCRW